MELSKGGIKMNKKVSEILQEILDIVGSVEYNFDDIYVDELEEDYERAIRAIEDTGKITEELLSYFYYVVEGNE